MRERLVQAARQFIYQLDTFEEEAVYAQISKELEEILSLNDEEILQERLAHIGIGEKEDYLNRYIETREGTVLAGIRHMGGKRDKPFVFMWAAFKIKDVKKVISDIHPYFKVFKPQAYHFWVRPDCNNYDEAAVIQQRFVGEIKNMECCEGALDKALDYYDWYEEEYRLFHKLRPEWIERVPVNPKDVMEECLQQGLLYEMREGDEIVGLIAGEIEQFLGRPTVYIDEILITADFRGKGYASKLLGRFIQVIDADYVACHIDSENSPSTRTALRAGEKLFSQECSVAISGENILDE